MPRLANTIAVIVGGAQGIGRSTAGRFVAEGATVHVGDVLDLDGGPEPAERLVRSRLDATDDAQVRAFVEGVIERHGRIDVLVNCAGVHLAKSVVDAEPHEFDRVFAVNVKATYLACRHVVPHMLARQRGSIVNVSSNGGLVGRPGDPIYTASKHAVIGLTRSMAVAYAQHGLRVNAVCPGPVDTPMLRGGLSDAEYEQRLPAFVASTPAARVARAGEVAAAILFLASDESPAVTGAALPVDGGKSAGVLTADRYRLDLELNRAFDR